MSNQPTVHVCIATGQNAANLIPLEQLEAREIWVLQTPQMKARAGHLQTALAREGRLVRRVDFDDSDPPAIARSADAVTLALDGRDVVLHATGGTKLMVLALQEKLRMVETGGGRLDILYAETARRRIDWLGPKPRTEAMKPVLDLQRMLQVQGYRIEGDSRPDEALQRALPRAKLTRELGDHAEKHSRYLGTLNWLASAAAEGTHEKDRTRLLNYAPGGGFAALLRSAQALELLRWDRDTAITFADQASASYLAGGWLEEYVLLKLAGVLRSRGQFSNNLRIVSVDEGVKNEIDAMLVHDNRALLIECKTRRQDDKAQDAIYKLAQLRDRLGGSVASALYLSARSVDDDILKRAREYRVDVLAAAEVAGLVTWINSWQARGI